MPPVVPIERGTIWWCDFAPVRGHEQDKRRSAVIVSAARFNQGRSGLVTVCPMTSASPKMPLHVLAPATLTRAARDLTVLCEHVRTIAVDRLDARPTGRVDETTMAQVEQNLKVLLGLRSL